jgi:membrane protein DedA with SNARE-associated domain
VEDIGQIIGGMEHFVRDHGTFAVAAIVALEALGAPLPGETALIFAGVLAAHGDMSLPALLILAWAGAVLGDNVGYVVGRKVGRATITHYGERIGLNAVRFNKVEQVFARYGAVTVAFARFVNVLRQLNGIVAGTLGMEWFRFLLFNAIGGALWVGVWVLGSFYLSEHRSMIAQKAHEIGIFGSVLVVLAIALAVLVKRVRTGQWV